MTFRFLHAADLHLDTPFTELGRLGDGRGEVLREASLDAFDALVGAAIEHDVSFVVLAGDIYDGAVRGIRAQIRFRDGLERLDHAGIRTLVVHGNHDPVTEGWTAITRFPDGVTHFPPDDASAVSFSARDGSPVTVYGISYATAATTENLARRFPVATTPGFHLGVLHANVGGIRGHDPYSPCTVEDLRATGYHYWALGHIHQRQVLSTDPVVIYPGNLQGRSPRASEQGAKGAELVTVEGTTVTEHRSLPLDRVRFVDVTVDIAPFDLDRLVSHLGERARELRDEHRGRSVLARLELTGRGPLHRDLGAGGQASELLRALQQDADPTPPFLWWTTIQLRTQPDLDLVAVRSRNDFLADILATAEELAGTARPRLFAEVEGRNPSAGAPGPGADPDDPRTAWLPLPEDLLRLLGDQAPRATDPDLWDEAVTTAIELLSEADR